MTDLETLIVGYRRRVIRLATLLRERQQRDPQPYTADLAAQRQTEHTEIVRGHIHDRWALHLLSDGELFPTATPPTDWDSLRRVADLLTSDLSPTSTKREAVHG